jgi:hypothetical protein
VTPIKIGNYEDFIFTTFLWDFTFFDREQFLELQGDFAEISLIFFVKTQHFSKETGQVEKNLQFQMQFPQLGQPGPGWIFSSEST